MQCTVSSITAHRTLQPDSVVGLALIYQKYLREGVALFCCTISALGTEGRLQTRVRFETHACGPSFYVY